MLENTDHVGDLGAIDQREAGWRCILCVAVDAAAEAWIARREHPAPVAECDVRPGLDAGFFAQDETHAEVVTREADAEHLAFRQTSPMEHEDAIAKNDGPNRKATDFSAHGSHPRYGVRHHVRRDLDAPTPQKHMVFWVRKAAVKNFNEDSSHA